LTFIFFITFYISSSFAPKLFILLPKSALFWVLGAKPLRCKASHAEERAAFRPTTSHPQLRKINCSLQNARAEKAAWWAAGWHAWYSTHSNFASAASAKKPTVKKPYQETPFKKWFLMDFRKLFRIR
jgi:hypothetical protein